jgi:hypothetical protein
LVIGSALTGSGVSGVECHVSAGTFTRDFFTGNPDTWRGLFDHSAFLMQLGHVTEIIQSIGSSRVAQTAIAKTDANGFYVFKSGAKIGYNTGAGGTIAQLTSKTTGVTLNKACGQITMEGGTLAAGASASFILTNGVIAATDVVNVSIASGATADAYTVNVTATTAGSCRIQVRNVSGGSLSEALTLNFAVIKAVTA